MSPTVRVLTLGVADIMMLGMRTTLTLDDDVVAVLREEMERSRRPFRHVVHQALRLGLRVGAAPETRQQFRVRPHDFRPLAP